MIDLNISCNNKAEYNVYLITWERICLSSNAQFKFALFMNAPFHCDFRWLRRAMNIGLHSAFFFSGSIGTYPIFLQNGKDCYSKIFYKSYWNIDEIKCIKYWKVSLIMYLYVYRDIYLWK